MVDKYMYVLNMLSFKNKGIIVIIIIIGASSRNNLSSGFATR